MKSRLIELVFVVYCAIIDDRLTEQERVSTLQSFLDNFDSLSGSEFYYVPDLVKDYLRLKIKEINENL